jgi:transcriptional regulator CtsR
MNKRHTIIISCVLAVAIILSGLAFADSQGKGDRRGFGSKRHHKGGGLMLLAKYEQKNLAVQVLSDLTKQSTEAISTKLKEKRIRTVMQELNIDRQKFRAKMQAKVGERIKQAATNGTITAKQEKEILAKMENRSKRRELMSQLIEKGIADGTITQEDAQMLLRKRH